MADGDTRNLTEAQIRFLEKFCSINVYFHRKQAKEKRESQAQEFRVFNLAAGGTQLAIDGLSDREAAKGFARSLAEATAILEGKGGKTNLTGALAKLDEINAAMEIHELQDRCRRDLPGLRDRAEKALASHTTNDVQIRAFLDHASDCCGNALKTGAKPDAQTAVAALERLGKLLDKTVAGNELAPTSGKVEAGKRELALKGLAVEKGRFDALVVRGNAAFKPAWPPALIALRDDAAKALQVEPGDTSEAITTKTKDAAPKVQTFADKAEAALKDHEDWTRARKAAASALADIKAHKMAADATHVAPAIAAQDLKLQAGDDKAAQFDFAGAAAEVQGIPPRVAEIFRLADDVAKLAAVRTTREQLVAATMPTTASTFDQVQKLVDAVRTLLSEAQSAADNGRLSEAVAKFDAIPAAVENAQVMLRHAKEYTDNYQELDDWRDDLAGKTGAVADAIATDLATCTTQLNDAATLSTTDLDKAIQKLGNMWRLINALNARVKDVETWLTDKKNFDDRLKAVKEREGDEGRVAIEDYYQRLLADKSRAEALVDPGAAIKEWVMASKIVTASKPLQADMIKLADLGKDYLARKKAIEEDLAEAEKKTDATISALAIAGTRTILATAAAQTVAKDWKRAVETLKTADPQVTRINDTITAAEQVTEARNDPALGNIAADFEAAFAAYTKAKGAADGRDSAGTFQTIRQEAETKAQQARTAATTPPGNPGAAGTLLTEAIGICERVVRLTGERTAFLNMENRLRADLATNLPGINTDDIIKDEIKDGEQARKDAVAKTRAPAFDYGSAIADIMQLQEQVETARRKATAYNDTVADRQTIKDGITYIDVAAAKPLLAPEIQRLKDLADEVKTLIDNAEGKKAVAKAREGAKLADAFKKLLDDYKQSKKWIKEGCTDARVNLLSMGSVAEVDTYAKADLAELDAAKVRADDLTQKRAFNAILGEARIGYQAGKAGERKITDGKAWEIVRKASADELKKLTDRRPIRNPFIAEKVDALEARYTAAMDQAKLENYAGAKKRLDTFVADARALDPLMAEFDRYRSAREEAGKALADLAKVKDTEAIEPLVARLRAQHAAAVAMADQGRLAEATTAFAAIRSGVDDAKDAAKEHEDFANLTEAAKSVPKGDGAEMKKRVEEGRKLLADLRKNKDYSIAMEEIAGAAGELDAAVKLADSDTDQAATHLQEAMRVCTLARLGISLFTQLLASEQKAQTEIADFLAKPEAAFVRDAAVALTKRLDASITLVRIEPTPANRKTAEEGIAAVMKEFATLTHAAAQQVVFDRLKQEVERKLADMDRHDQRFAMKEDIALIRQIVATTSAQAEKHDHDNAIARLKKAQDRQEAALIKAEMVGDRPPSVGDIKKILAREGGSDTIDEIVAALDDTAKKKVLRVAFEARYGCKLEVNKKVFDQVAYDNWLLANPTANDEAKKEKEEELTTYPEVADGEDRDADLQKFYKVMVDLPDSDTLDNDSMIEFEATGGPAEGSFYGGGKKRVTMREGKFGDSGIYGLGLKHELDEIDPDATPEDAPGISYFSWNTLHEVGHAVDDKQSFMKNRGAALAGWKEYGSNTYPVAEAVAGKFDFDATYLAEYLRDVAEPPIPEPKGGVESEEWERRRVLARAWCDRARTGNEPWQSAALAKAVEIDGICYQESYDGSWTSYPIAQRKKGVSGYQFRAPGEWFAELYAAFHTGKMNKGHPARAWLEQL